MLIEELATLFGPTVARQLIAWFLNGELVIVGEFLAPVDFPHSKDDDVLLAVDIDHTGVAVRLARMVYKPCCVAMHGGVYHLIVINAKHVAANALLSESNFH